MTVSLAEERLNRGLSMKQAALEAGVNLNVWSRAEKGKAVHPGNAHKIASFLGYQVTDIWPIEEEAA